MIFIVSIVLAILAATLVVILHEGIKRFIALSQTHGLYRKNNDIQVNPLSFIDPLGLFLFVICGVGWQKPQKYNKNRMINKEKSYVYIMLSGIILHVILIAIALPIYRYFDVYLNYMYVEIFLKKFIAYNISLFLINLLPIPPFDMAEIVTCYYPVTNQTMKGYEPYFQLGLVLLIILGVVPQLVQSILYVIM